MSLLNINLKIAGNIICFTDDRLYNFVNHCINDIKTWLDNNFLELNYKQIQSSIHKYNQDVIV
ncbi:hypothetical protein FWK35_00021552 [Aphis craccivora]|uniref:Uncharacterized protein n=1 Tax=Aphis craccivora TaxID=307492 RepID=A0A6G0Y7L4_APHCR|nr:hypothetical protein FWK35_00021552 [Aphis craccivora]